MRGFLALFCCFCLIGPLAHAAEDEGSGLPVPRFVSLRADEVNVRTGPGQRYPIRWVYRRGGWPVEIVEEFDHWRKIRDMEGTTGWVHKTMLSGKRTALVRAKTPVVLRSEAEEDAAPVLKAAPGVLCTVVECTKSWCRVQLNTRKGWLKKTSLFGVYPNEVVD